MSEDHRAVMAHLLRRAGFATRLNELDAYAAKDYDEVVEDLLHPERSPDDDEDILLRYYRRPHSGDMDTTWIPRILNGKKPLREKMALFFHQVFATQLQKVSSGQDMAKQIDLFRRFCLSDLRTILIELSRDPAMIFWLDNNENHKDAPNENYGRELLELFTMGVGNYTEDDVKAAASAFTGWTFRQRNPSYAAGEHGTVFLYREEEHDDSVKTFLGETGHFNGDDIIDIIVKQPATARFISRHLYNFFVADEPPVPAWSTVPPQDPEAIDTLVKAYFDSGGEFRAILRVLLSSDFFKEARFKKLKSPMEMVAGIIKLVDTYRFPDPGIRRYMGKGAGGPSAVARMGQSILNPPTVEGWHTGKGWINAGTLTERVNFAVNEVGDADKPGVQAIMNRLSAKGTSLSPDEFVDRCLDLVGPLPVGDVTRNALIKYASSGGELAFTTSTEQEESRARIVGMLQLIVASREYQFV